MMDRQTDAERPQAAPIGKNPNKYGKYIQSRHLTTTTAALALTS